MEPSDKIWPPAPTSQVPRTPPRRAVFPLRILVLSLCVSVMLGVRDASHGYETIFVVNLPYFLASAVLAWLEPKWAWLWAALLSVGLYGVHLAAIALGVPPPYVERDFFSALDCFWTLPVGLSGALLGCCVR